MDQQDLGLRLKELRQQANLTQSQLANKVGITRQALSSYELGKRMPSAETLSKLSSVLNTDLIEILFKQATARTHPENNSSFSSKINNFLSMFTLYSKLPPLSQDRIMKLLKIMTKDERNPKS